MFELTFTVSELSFREKLYLRIILKGEEYGFTY